MEMHDSLSGKEGMEQQPPAPQAGRVSLDRLELQRQWVQQAEEQQAEETLNLYAKAARQRMQAAAPELPENSQSEEEREAESQRLKLQQKGQDIAALIMVDELEEEPES